MKSVGFLDLHSNWNWSFVGTTCPNCATDPEHSQSGMLIDREWTKPNTVEPRHLEGAENTQKLANAGSFHSNSGSVLGLSYRNSRGEIADLMKLTIWLKSKIVDENPA